MEHLVLECLLAAPEPIDSVLACSRACGVTVAEARAALEELTREGLIVWVPPARRWDATEAGLAALGSA
jgi:hypothetical protein